jgi:cobalt/nickel transport system ATP-binding protein
MIELKDISYTYDKLPALCHISLKLEEGKCYVLEGPNGSGKSTLFRILNGLSFAQSGEYLLDGEKVTEKKMNDPVFAQNLHRKIGYLFQNSETQLFTRSVEDEVSFGLYQLGYSEEEVHERTEAYLKLLDIESLRKRAPYSLSGGEKKRCALAAVLAMEPETLILDEPLAGLDEDGMTWMTGFLLSLKEKKRTILIATHNHDLSEAAADIIIRFNKHHEIAEIRKMHA